MGKGKGSDSGSDRGSGSDSGSSDPESLRRAGFEEMEACTHTEMISMDESLQACQLAALRCAQETARERHNAALPKLQERVQRLGFPPEDLDVTLGWLKDHAPILIPVDLAKVGGRLLKDTHFRNEFETESCDPIDDWQRAAVEEALFQGAYENAPASSRCKYGVLEATHDGAGVSKRSDIPWVLSEGTVPWSYLVLKDVRHRTTFTSRSWTSAALDLKHIHLSKLATMDHYAHFLEEYTDAELLNVMEVDCASDFWRLRSYMVKSFLMDSCKEAQIHGDVRLADNVELIMVNPHLHCTYSPHTKAATLDMLGKLATHCNASLVWMDMDHASPHSSSCAIKPSALSLAKSTPYPVPAPLPLPSEGLVEEEDDELQRALKASQELLEEQRRLWAQSELDLARAMQLSVEDDMLAKAVEASLALAGDVALVAVVAGPPHIIEPAESLIFTHVVEARTETEHVLKVSHGDDLRRLRISWPGVSGPGEISAAIEAAVCRSFDLPSIGHCLKYEDEDGDLCTLVTATVADYMSLCQGVVLKKVCVCVVPQQTIAHSPEAVPACIAGAAPFAEEAARIPTLACSEEAEPSTQEAASYTTDVAPSTREARPSIEEAALSEEVAVDSAEDSSAAANMLATEVLLLSADASLPAAEEVRPEPAAPWWAAKGFCCNEAALGWDCDSLCKGPTAEKSTSVAPDEPAAAVVATSTDIPSVTLYADAKVLAAEAMSSLTEAPAISSPSEVLQFSMETPPASPRAGVEALQSTRIEDEYEDDCVAWTFVAEPAE